LINNGLEVKIGKHTMPQVAILGILKLTHKVMNWWRETEIVGMWSKLGRWNGGML